HDRYGNPIEGASFLMVFNAHHEPIEFTLAEALGDHWVTVIDTAAPDHEEPAHAGGDTLEIESRSVRVLRRR
ncbi:MAG TPA: hypothetical protein VFN48_03980, partial [Solirubrobacteraceae bacterium]|nr:hypothetical protein [Solirubrobacteraceae bacterium]